MPRDGLRLALILALVGISAPAAAQSERGELPDSGYCDYVKGVAHSESALLFSPSLIGSFGYIDQQISNTIMPTTQSDLRLTAGLQYRLDGIYDGFLVRKRAAADCERNNARVEFTSQESTAEYEALSARESVLSSSLGNARKLLARDEKALRQRRTTAQSVTATRLRVDELSSLLSETRRAIAYLQKSEAGARPTEAALADYYAADAEVLRLDSKLRSARAWDVVVSGGYDRFLDADDESPYFAIVSARFNLGWIFQAPAERRAAEGRRRMLEEESDFDQQVQERTARVRITLEAEEKRLAETKVLVEDLASQLRKLRNIGSDAVQRYRQLLWFEHAKVKAEHDYLEVHVNSLKRLSGGEPL